MDKNGMSCTPTLHNQTAGIFTLCHRALVELKYILTKCLLHCPWWLDGNELETLDGLYVVPRLKCLACSGSLVKIFGDPAAHDVAFLLNFALSPTLQVARTVSWCQSWSSALRNSVFYMFGRFTSSYCNVELLESCRAELSFKSSHEVGCAVRVEKIFLHKCLVETRSSGSVGRWMPWLVTTGLVFAMS